MQKVELNKIEEYLNSCGFEFQILLLKGFLQFQIIKIKP